MSFLEKKYKVTGWYGDVKLLTAKQLEERVLEDSKSDYNWIAPARELVKICKELSFPVEYAHTIEIAILNCFSNIEHRANYGCNRYWTDPEDEEAVQYCYNCLYGIDREDAVTARKRFLTEMINTASHVRLFGSLYHPGPTYQKLRENWRKSKFEEYISQEEIDFKQLVEILRSNFDEVIKIAESNGDFEEDEKKEKKIRKMVFQEINDLI